MDTQLLQFSLALPLWLGGMGWFIWALLNPRNIGMIGMCFFSFILQFCTGPVVAPLMAQPPSPFGSRDVALAFAGIYTFWFAIGLVALLWKSHLDPVFFDDDEQVDGRRGVFSVLAEASLRTNLIPVIVLYFLLMLVRVYVEIRYQYGLIYSGEAILQMPYALFAILLILGYMGLGCAYICFVRLIYKYPGRLLCIIIVASELIFTFLRGRRFLLLLCLTLFFALIVKVKKMRLKHAILSLIVFLIVWEVALPLFYFMRLEWQERRYASVTSWVVEGWRKTFSPEKELHEANVEGRLRALEFNYAIAKSLNGGLPTLKGDILKTSFVYLIPSVVYRGKWQYLRSIGAGAGGSGSVGGADDLLVSTRLNLATVDQTSNLPAFGIGDFGILGCFVYGLVFISGIRFIEKMFVVTFRRSYLGAVVIFGSVVQCPLLQMELTISFFLLILRMTIIIFVIFYLLSKFHSRSEYSGFDDSGETEALTDYVYPLSYEDL